MKRHGLKMHQNHNKANNTPKNQYKHPPPDNNQLVGITHVNGEKSNRGVREMALRSQLLLDACKASKGILSHLFGEIWFLFLVISKRCDQRRHGNHCCQSLMFLTSFSEQNTSQALRLKREIKKQPPCLQAHALPPEKEMDV